MAVITTEPPSTPTRTPVAQQLSTLDRYLPVWILAAMVVGLLLGRVVPGIGTALAAVEVDGVSLPISIGLLVMMYPVLAKVRYDRLGTVTHDRRMLVSSLLLNWVVGPLVMFTLAWTFLADLPTYRTGLIIVGLARCIAMVIIWNDLACGDREAAAVLVAINSIFQVVAFAALGWFYLSALPSWLGLEQTSLNVSAWQIAKSVLIFLGIPLVAGYLTRTLGENAWGRETYEHSFLPKIGPWALYGLLFTIVVLFALQGEQITSPPPRRRPHRPAAPGLLRGHVGHRPPARTESAPGLRTHHHPRLHRRRQQLRTRHRRRHLHLRCHRRPSPRRRRRPPDRGPGPHRTRLHQPLAAQTLPRRQPALTSLLTPTGAPITTPPTQ